MKTIHYILMLSAAVLLGGCAHEKFSDENASSSREGRYTVSVKVSQTPETKTTITQSGKILPVKWEDGDVLYVFGATDGYLGSLSMESTGAGEQETTFTGELSEWTSAQVLHVYYLGKEEPTITGDKFTYDLSEQRGTLSWIADSAHVAHAATSSLSPGPVKVSVTMENLNAVTLFDLSDWTEGVEIKGTYNKAVLDLKTGQLDTASRMGSISLAKKACTDKAYVAFIPATKALTFKKGGYSTKTAANTMTAGKFYSKLGDAIKIPAIYVGGEDVLPGKFSVSATNQVQFSKGNLQAYVSSGSVTSATALWKFADNQYDYIGSNNISGSTFSSNIDLFGWSTNSGTQAWGINLSTNASDYAGSFVDWGALMSNGFRTLKGGESTSATNEWQYLLYTRQVNGGTGEGKSFQRATINTDATSVYGLILYPDNYTAQISSPYKCTSAEWIVMEKNGCVFLPAAGYRSGTTITSTGSYATYWTSTSWSSTHRSGLYFGTTTTVNAAGGSYPNVGCAVRLVVDVNDKGGYTEDGWGYGPGIEVNGVIWAPVNCGIGYNSAYPYGKLYQFARKVGSGYDINEGMQEKAVASTYMTTDNCNKTPENGKFYYNTASPYDWYTNSGTRLTEWPMSDPTGTTGIGNPCPSGWRVPTIAEWNSLIANKSTWSSVNGQSGYYFSGSTTYSTSVPNVFIPAAGDLSASAQTTENRSTVGLYWSSEISGTNAKFLYMKNGIVNTEQNWGYRGYGCSVRCVYDATTSSTVTAESFTDRISW